MTATMKRHISSWNSLQKYFS